MNEVYKISEFVQVYEGIMDSERDEVTNPLMTGFIKGCLMKAVDKGVAAFDSIEMLIEQNKNLELLYEKRRKNLEKIKERFKEVIKETIQNSSLPALTGEESRRGFKLQKNSLPKIKWKQAINITQKTLNILDPVSVSLLSEHQEFLTRSEVYSIDTEAVKEAIKSGRELPFAELEYDFHVRKF